MEDYDNPFVYDTRNMAMSMTTTDRIMMKAHKAIGIFIISRRANWIGAMAKLKKNYRRAHNKRKCVVRCFVAFYCYLLLSPIAGAALLAYCYILIAF